MKTAIADLRTEHGKIIAQNKNLQEAKATAQTVDYKLSHSDCANLFPRVFSLFDMREGAEKEKRLL